MTQTDRVLSQKYNKLTDVQLIVEMKNGNLEIPFYLLYDKYKEPILTKIGKVLFGIQCKYTEIDKEDWRDRIYIHLTEPRKRNETLPYTSISEDKILFAWLMDVIQNYILTEFSKTARNVSIDNQSISANENKESDEYKITMIRHLEFLNSLSDPKERYIIFSHILCSYHKQGTTSTHFSERVAQILGLTPGNVRVILKRVRDKMRAKLNESKLYGCKN